MRTTFELLLILLLMLFNGVLAMAEIAVVSARKTRLKQLADDGSRRAKAALKLANNPGRFLSTVQVGISLIGVLAGAFGGARLASHLAPFVARITIVAPYAQEIAFAVTVAWITYLSLVIGELVPKQIALRNAEPIAMLVAGPMAYFAKILHPMVQLLLVSTNLVLRFVPKGQIKDAMITEDEVKLIIRQATEAGVVMTAEREMIDGVLRLGDLRANDLMTPRPEMVLLDDDEPIEKTLVKIGESGHTYFPLYSKDPSIIIGIVSVKDLWNQISSGKKTGLRAVAGPPLFVPETMTALRLLEKFKTSKVHLAIVLDEHGGIEGLVSINDVLKGIVGDIQTMGDDEEPEVVERDDGSWLLDGGLSASDLKDLLKVKKLPREDGSYTTVGGLVMTRLGRIPKAGDSFKWRGYRFEVVDMDRHRVDKVLVAHVPKTPATSAKTTDRTS